MTLETVFMKSQRQLKKKLHVCLCENNYNPVNRDGFLFAQGTHPVLLVAHLDTVHRQRVRQICYSKDKSIMMSPQGIGGDDRCGVYMILQIIKTHKCSVLFCEDEEIGAVGAIKFVESGIIPENVNYIIELDRRGSNDAVFYNCFNPSFIEHIAREGFVERDGSFSDISEIAPHLGIAAVNLSCGYYNAHTLHEYVNLNEMRRNVKRVRSLISKESGRFEYTEKIYAIADYDFLCGDYIRLMRVTEEIGYVVDEYGVIDYDTEWYVGQNNKLYLYDWDTYYTYEMHGYRAKTNEGAELQFRENLAETMPVLNYWEDFI